MRRAQPNLLGIVITDRLTTPNKNDSTNKRNKGPTQDLPPNFTVISWTRCELENYIFTPGSLIRAAASDQHLFKLTQGITKDHMVAEMKTIIKNFMTPAALSNLEDETTWVKNGCAQVLVDILGTFCKKLKITTRQNLKADFFQLVPYLNTTEIHTDIKQALALIKELILKHMSAVSV
jgi:hypothetical protein